jgi:hypothetical protein
MNRPLWSKLASLAIFCVFAAPFALGDGETQPECVRLHYPGIVEMISAKLAAGEPLPDGLNEAVKQFPEYKVKLTARKGVQE